MDLNEIKKTDLWTLYQESRNYARLINMYSDTDRNYRMYNGNQWEGLPISGIEPVMLNFIKPVVKYKVGTINSNQYGIVFTSENFENKKFRKTAERVCELLNKKASKVWEKDQMDLKVRHASRDSAINSEGIIYVTYDKEKQTPINEILNKNDVYYGNENDSNIQNQPYVLIKRRLPVSTVQEFAKSKGVSEDKLTFIVGDNDTFEEAGTQAKYEKDDMCTVLTKMYKEKGFVYYETSTQYLEIEKEVNSGLKYYPVAHMIWEEKEGSARGEGEVKNLIPNQLEVNKTIMRRLITVKYMAYPTKIVNTEKISNPKDVGKVGVTIKTKNGMTVDDVNKVIGIVNPAHMSSDVEKVQNEIINLSRELAGAGDIATGDFNPEQASGKAILAVQNASQQPLTEQLVEMKTFIEDIARIWLDHLTTYSEDGIELEEEITDEATGEKYTQLVNIPQTVLQELEASVKVDITPKGAFDRYAQELTLENMLKAGYFNAENLSALKTYVSVLPDDATAPKGKLEDAVEIMEEEQRKIAMIENEAQIMQQRANQFLMGDIDDQAMQISEAENQIQAEREATGEERGNVNG